MTILPQFLKASVKRPFPLHTTHIYVLPSERAVPAGLPTGSPGVAGLASLRHAPGRGPLPARDEPRPGGCAWPSLGTNRPNPLPAQPPGRLMRQKNSSAGLGQTAPPPSLPHRLSSVAKHRAPPSLGLPISTQGEAWGPPQDRSLKAQARRPGTGAGPPGARSVC